MNTEWRPSVWPWVVVLLCLAAHRPVLAQESDVVRRDTAVASSDSVAKQPAKWRFIHRNEIETPFFTLRLGAAVLIEHAWYGQDEASKQQLNTDPDAPKAPSDPVESVVPSPEATASAQQADAPAIDEAFKFRDTRFMLNGRIKTKRPITWSTGLMWDAPNREWLVRQTGFVVAVPEFWGHLWIGRSKEGTSLNRVMVGYDGWTMERFAFSDASIPLLADGIRWMGYVPEKHLLWNLGVFDDYFSKGQTFSSYEHQAVARIAYLKMDSDTAGNLLHVGVLMRYGKPTDDTLHLKSKPESNTAPNFVDTGKFHATSSTHVGIEAYYRPGNWLFGTEYYLQRANSPEMGDPFFHGGDIMAAWLVSGETRPYRTVGGYFRSIDPDRRFFEGGWGALELVMRLSYIDLTDGTLEGGKFWRLTPTINWYFNRFARLEAAYGYGVLDRFDLKGTTHFFQTRLQLQM